LKHRAAFLALLLAACSAGQDAPKDAYGRGVAALDRGDARTARIEFLNAIKADPDNKALRIMQARAYLALGDGVAAEAELARARQLNVPADRSRPLMAHALILQGRHQEALQELAEASGPYAERMRGRAQQALGNEAEAGAAFARAVALAPEDDLAWTDLARFRRAKGDTAGALDAAARAVTLKPTDVEALTLRGELTRSQYGLRAAIPWFDRAIEIDPDDIQPRLERAATLGDLGEMTGMLAETRKVIALAPGNPMAYYLQAMLAARAGKYSLARSLYQRTDGKLDEQPAAMLLASAIDFQTGNPSLAATRLTRLLERQPDNFKARRLLGAAQWRSGDATAAVATLRPLADRPDADTYTLSLIGKALAGLGDARSASLYLTRAAQPQPADGTMPIGEVPNAARLAVLREEAAESPGAAQPQVQLIRALLALGQSGEALQRARRLQAANPGVPDVHILVGDALGIQGNFAEAAEQYRKAANISFTEPVAMRMIEALDRSGQADAAAKVLAIFLQQNPRNTSAQLLAAGRHLEAGQWPQAIALYEDIRRRLGDSDAIMLNNLAWAYSEEGDYAAGLPLAKKAWLLDKSNPATADTYGWLLFRSGTDKARGLVLLERAARAAPGDRRIGQHLRSARGR
jgi:tetratricopeptide (TPR) repeat protein